MKKFFACFFSLVAALLIALPSFAYDLPSVNLGFTSFLDGGPPSGPGLYWSQYLQYWGSDSFRNADGNDAFPPGVDEELNAWITISQFIYQSDKEFFLGGKGGLNIMIPFVHLDMSYNTAGPFPEDNGGGAGDVLVGPYIQWDPIMGANGPRFMHRFEFQINLPTGSYSGDKELNPGSNFVSFNPYWAFTAFVMPGWTFSSRLHYLYCFTNDEPNRAYGDVKDTQAGQAFHANFATEYEVIPNMLRLGINGYYLNQFTDMKVDGKNVAGSREKVFAIGPGGVFHFSKEDHLFLNFYFETDAENRPEGTRVNTRYVHHF